MSIGEPGGSGSLSHRSGDEGSRGGGERLRGRLLRSRALPSASRRAGPTTVWLIGDSLTSIKRAAKRPETGWGMPFAELVGAEVAVRNHAVNGHSTQRFIDEGRWGDVVTRLRAGHWVLIQFGHNDENVERFTHTTPEQFADNLRRFDREIRDRRATPILLTPVAIRRFAADGSLLPSHPYSPIVRSVADELGTRCLDIDAASQALLTRIGEEASRSLFLHLGVGEHPNHPDGVADDVHLNELGAEHIARLVVEALHGAGVEWARSRRSSRP